MRTDPDTQPTQQGRALACQAAREFNIPVQLAEILQKRGFDSLETLRDFLHPQLSMLPTPDTMKGMGEAVACLCKAYRQGRTIFVHGDYDADGITATALLMSFFRETGAQAVYYIPNRMEEKYGLSRGSIDTLMSLARSAEGGVLVSVDCGITAVEEVEYARQRGLKVVITDHHEPQETLPRAQAVLNPKQRDCAFPFAGLSGVGVAFFLLMALRKGLVERRLLAGEHMPNLKSYLDLVALGTVADVVPLVDINRVLVRAGLEVLSAKRRPGVLSLCEQCDLQTAPVLAEDISFKLAPRINACGRLGVPERGVELLLARDLQVARQAAQDLEELNTERKRLEQLWLPEILEKGGEQVRAGRRALTIFQEHCHPGVLGILASRVVDRFGRPAILLTAREQEEGIVALKGSGRSVPGINLFQLVERCVGHVEQFGGHAMAVGLTMARADLEGFAEAMDVAAGEADWDGAAPTLSPDYRFTDKRELNRAFVHALQVMQPFGEGNPEPVFLLEGERLLEQKNVNGHLLFQVRVNGMVLRGIGFNLAEAHAQRSGPVDLFFKIKKTWFRGSERDQLQAIHMEGSDPIP